MKSKWAIAARQPKFRSTSNQFLGKTRPENGPIWSKLIFSKPRNRGPHRPHDFRIGFGPTGFEPGQPSAGLFQDFRGRKMERLGARREGQFADVFHADATAWHHFDAAGRLLQQLDYQ